MKIVTVIPLKKGAFQENLTYFTAKDITLGDVVEVFIRNQKVLGLVVSFEEADTARAEIKGMDFNLKKIIEVKEKSLFSKEFLDSALSVNKYFAGRINNTVACLIPSVLKEEYDAIASYIPTREKEVIDLPQKIKTEKMLFQAPLTDRISYYKTAIRESFALKKSIFIILPNERDIESFHEVLAKGIEGFAFALHGGLSSKKAIVQIEQILTLPHPILILGTAPFLSIPRHDIGTIIIEHESRNAYKMIERPHIDLRLFAEIFAGNIHAKFILADSLLRFETIARKEEDNFAEIQPLSFRINFDGQIRVWEKNPRDNQNKERNWQGEKKKQEFKIFKDETLEVIRDTISKGKNIFIFSLRKGLATYTVCRDCSEPLMCPRCSAPLVLYLSRDGTKRMFICNRCKEEIDSNTKCASCGSWNLMPLGIGVDTVFEEMKNRFPDVKILKLDKETAKGIRGAERIVKEFEENPGSILVGTEMATFYLKNKVPVSVIASFDSLWSIPNYKMSEKVIQLVLSIVSKTEHTLIIETKNDTDPAIQAITQENLLSFIREELAERKNLGYPPFKRFIKITYFGNKTETQEAKSSLQQVFQEYNPEIFSGFIAKESDKYATNVLLRLDTQKWVDEKLLGKLTMLPSSYEISVDPEDLL